jgi:dTMP kinase
MLIAIEGIDGSGKGTQAKLLKERLQKRGVRVSVMSFPQYDCTVSGAQIGEYLNGKYGDLHPKIAVMLFAMDRAESLRLLAAIQSVDDVVILDRWVSSNIAHQFVRLPGGSASNNLAAFAGWVEMLEYESLQIPRADMTIWLETPVSVAVENIAK